MDLDIPGARCIDYVKKNHEIKRVRVVFNLDRRIDMWIPYSAISEDSEVYRPGDTGKLVIKKWFAEKKKWL